MVLFGSTTREQEEQKTLASRASQVAVRPDTASEPLPACNVSDHMTVLVRGWIFFFF